MRRRALFGFAGAAAVAVVLPLTAGSLAAGSAANSLMPTDGQRHHYTVGARVRPLLFWISNDDVGDALVAKKQDATRASYALLIGSDPAKTPMHVNRWGYIAEDIRGDQATVVGLMTESNEASAREAEAHLRDQSTDRNFDIIHESVARGEVRSVVTTVAAPASYTYRQVDSVLALAARTGTDGSPRVIGLPPQARTGFLSALAELMHRQATQLRAAQPIATGDPVAYTYHGKRYELRATRAKPTTNVHVAHATVDRAIASQFQVKNVDTGDLTDFSVTYAVDGPLAEMPLTATYRPRWWIEIQLTLDDSDSVPLLAAITTGANR